MENTYNNTNQKEDKTIVDQAKEKIDEIKEEREEEKRTSVLSFDDYVIEKIAAIATREVPGVLALKGGMFSGITDVFASSTDTNTSGVSVQVDEKNVYVDLKAILEYGQSAPRIFSKVKETITHQVANMTGLNVIAVNMKVEDIMTRKEWEEKDKKNQN